MSLHVKSHMAKTRPNAVIQIGDDDMKVGVGLIFFSVFAFFFIAFRRIYYFVDIVF